MSYPPNVPVFLWHGGQRAWQLERLSSPPEVTAIRWWACHGGNLALHCPLWRHILSVHSHLPPARLQAASSTDCGKANLNLLIALYGQNVVN